MTINFHCQSCKKKIKAPGKTKGPAVDETPEEKTAGK